MYTPNTTPNKLNTLGGGTIAAAGASTYVQLSNGVSVGLQKKRCW